jgi:DJ-1/PfpI family
MIPHNTHLHIGSLLFEDVDQIDLTGPFEVLSRLPNATYRICGKTAALVRDLKGLRLTPDATLADAPALDVLHVPGGFGQEALMEDAEVLGWIRQQASGACSIFSVCTGALLCGGAGLLKGRRATIHWSSVSPAALFQCDPRQRTGCRRRRVGFCCRRHGGHRRRLTPRRRVARRRGRTGLPAQHGLCAGTALRQRHTRDSAIPDPGTGASIGADDHNSARTNGPSLRRQTRYRRSSHGQRMASPAPDWLARTEGLLARLPTAPSLKIAASTSARSDSPDELSRSQDRIRPRALEAGAAAIAVGIRHDPEHRGRDGELIGSDQQPRRPVRQCAWRQLHPSAGSDCVAHQRGDQQQHMGRGVPYGTGSQGRHRSGGCPGHPRGPFAEGQQTGRAVGPGEDDDPKAWTSRRRGHQSIPRGGVGQRSPLESDRRGRRVDDHELHGQRHQAASRSAVSGTRLAGLFHRCGFSAMLRQRVQAQLPASHAAGTGSRATPSACPSASCRPAAAGGPAASPALRRI